MRRSDSNATPRPTRRKAAAREPGVTAAQLATLGIQGALLKSLLRSGALEKTDTAGLYRWSEASRRSLAALVR